LSNGLGNPANRGRCVICNAPFVDEQAHQHGPCVLSSLTPTTPLAFQPPDKPAPMRDPGAAYIHRPKRSK
jgi:hypothetical protein